MIQLVIGNKNYSSWSMRPWLLLHANQILFEEVYESLRPENRNERLHRYSGSSKVPVLFHNDICVWDSLSICEYISETFLEGTGWPSDKKSRAEARSVVAEMHSSFHALRAELPMNCRLLKPVKLSASVQKDVQRIESIWSEFAAKSEDASYRLFGRFNIADCFFAPVALRFKSYDIQLSGRALDYQNSLTAHPSVLEWVKQANSEAEVLCENEI